MPINVLMPALSPTMTEGKLAKWLKNAGDQIAPGDVLAEIETDKATMEVEAVDGGRLAEIKIAAGTENVPVNSLIAVMLADGEDEAALKAAPAPIATPKATEPALLVPETPKVQPVSLAPVGPMPANSGDRVKASPLAKRIAKERGINLSTLSGSGPGGRIVRADVEKSRPTTPSSEAPKSSIDARRLADLLGMKYRTEANSTVRKTIARRLTEAKQTIPHFYLTVDCNLDALMALRTRLNEREGAVKLSVNDFMIKAVAIALKKVPAANASWADAECLYYENADISVAVATDNGLITPVIKNADQKPLGAISAEMKDLGVRARAGKLKPEEYQGGTFSLSNLGMFGIREFSAIINPPQACILAVGAGEQRPIIKDGQLAVATMMTCTLSVDHRVVDGAVGAQYLAAFKKLVEDPLDLVLYGSTNI
jgi:pyruvate dehydrogenase E2 component (dihydrolipoamide acetyltransferase)